MTLVRPVATLGAESCTLHKDIIKRLAVFERKVLSTIFVGIKVHETWRNRHDKDLMQLFGDLDKLSFLRISRLKRIGYVNRLNSKRTVRQVFNKFPGNID